MNHGCKTFYFFKTLSSLTWLINEHDCSAPVKVIMNDELGQKWEEAVEGLSPQNLIQNLCITIQIKTWLH